MHNLLDELEKVLTCDTSHGDRIDDQGAAATLSTMRERYDKIGDDAYTDTYFRKTLGRLTVQIMRQADPSLQKYLGRQVVDTCDLLVTALVAKDVELARFITRKFMARTLIIYQAPDALPDIYRWAAGTGVQLTSAFVDGAYSAIRQITPKYREHILILPSDGFNKLAESFGADYGDHYNDEVICGSYSIEKVDDPTRVLPRKVVLYGAFEKDTISAIHRHAYCESVYR